MIKRLDPSLPRYVTPFPQKDPLSRSEQRLDEKIPRFGKRAERDMLSSKAPRDSTIYAPILISLLPIMSIYHFRSDSRKVLRVVSIGYGYVRTRFSSSIYRR